MIGSVYCLVTDQAIMYVIRYLPGFYSIGPTFDVMAHTTLHVVTCDVWDNFVFESINKNIIFLYWLWYIKLFTIT